MLRPLFLFGALLTLLIGCSPRGITSEMGLSIANDRYQAIASGLGGVVTPIPSPAVNVRAEDTVYKYLEPKTQKTIIVIVKKTGEFADTYQD
jgi:hypothetical protein